MKRNDRLITVLSSESAICERSMQNRMAEFVFGVPSLLLLCVSEEL